MYGAQLIALVLLNIVDAWLTLYQVDYLGAYEANPVMGALIEYSPQHWVGIKVAIVTLLLALLFVLPVPKRRLYALRGVVRFIISVYSLVVVYHIFLIMAL